MSDLTVRAQYEAFPYPARDPADEAKRLVTGSPGEILEVNHYLFAGRRDFAKPFRALVAGGGTGDATIMLAQQLQDAGCPAEVLYLDLSTASREICEARAEARGLGNIRFERMSILDLPASGLGPFDYIDCCGVLHHLEDPAGGLQALADVLAPGGGMGLMLYGELGRTGVYHMQGMMKLLDDGAPEPDRVKLAKKLLSRLPDTNWLKRNPFIGDHLEGGDAGLYDLFLHSRDRAYRVPEIADLVRGAGLEIVTFIEPVRYDPATYINDPKLLERLETRPWLERAAFAELLAGNLRKHIFYVVPGDRAGSTLADPTDMAAVPHLRDLNGTSWAKEFRPDATIRAPLDGFVCRQPLPPLSGAMVGRMDEKTPLQGIFEDMRMSNSALDEATFAKQFDQLFRAFNGLGKLYLSFPPGGI